MGHPIVWPIFEATKYYHCTVQAWQAPSGPQGCDIGTMYTVKCCHLGSSINTWIAGHVECVPGFELCTFSGYSSQRLISATGPFDTIAECYASG